ncbi:MAG: outer membrane protein assembly factor BamD [Verrucomicrobium sp.]
MKVHPVLRVTLTTASALAIAVPSAPAVDFGKANPLKWFKGKEETVPSASEKNSQEAAAAEMLRDAKTAASTGNSGRAQSLYKDIVARYRFTDAASVAQFEHSALLRSSGKLQDAYDGYQKFINNYRQSPRFNDALQQQFEIAEEAKAGKKQPSLLLIPMKLDKSELVKMYEGVIKNSPYGKYSPYAQFAIGEVYQDDGDKAMANASYQAVVENYPNTKLASEAQFRIGAISSAAARKTQDAQNLNATRDALESYKLTNPTGERTGEAESLIQEVNTSQSFRSLEIGKFYEKSGKAKAAAIYYNEAIKFGAPEAALDARNRLAGLAAAFPDEMKEQAATGGVADYTVPAAVNLKNRDEYSGPPAPLIAKVNRKPEMRVEPDSFQPVPLKEPELPTRPGTEAPNPGMILPPADGKPAPGAPLPVPPVPAGALEAPSLAPLPVPAPPAPAPAPEAAAPAPAPVPEAPAPAPEPAPKAN